MTANPRTCGTKAASLNRRTYRHYRGLTREAYTLDFRQFTTWCRVRSLNLFAVRRADIEGFARDLEARGRARATVTRRLCTIAGFYRYAVSAYIAGAAW